MICACHRGVKMKMIYVLVVVHSSRLVMNKSIEIYVFQN